MFKLLVMHAYRCEIKGVIMSRLEYAYMLEKNIGPLMEAMQNNHGGSFSMDILNHLSSKKWYSISIAKEESIFLFSCLPGIYGPQKVEIPQSPWALCTGGMEVPLCDTWLKQYAYEEGLW